MEKFILTNNDCENEYDSFDDCDDDRNHCINNDKIISANIIDNFDLKNISEKDIPKSSEIYISTKTKIAYLNNPINLKDMFWIIPVLKYMEPKMVL